MKFTSYNNWEQYKKFFMEQFPMEGSYVICGIGEGYHTLIELFPEVKVQYCLDATIKEAYAEEGQVYPYGKLLEQDIQTLKFIITAGSEYYAEIKNCLLRYNVAASQICSLPEVLFFWGVYSKGKIFSTGCNVFLLTNCNLRCKGCSQFTPYIRHHRYNSAESIQESLNQYFRVFDYVKDLILVGGETLLYRELGEICEYIQHHFSKRYHELKIFTNGLIFPDLDILDALNRVTNVHVIISDYTCSIQERHIRYTLNDQFGQTKKDHLWFDLGDPTQLKDQRSHPPKEKFEKCSLVCQNLVDGKVCYCVPACAAMMGDINALDDPAMWLCLSELGAMSFDECADQVGKFSLGFLGKGYLEFCRFCNGFGTDVNQKFIQAGEQC